MSNKRIEEFMGGLEQRRVSLLESREQKARGLASDSRLIELEGQRVYNEFVEPFRQASEANKIKDVTLIVETNEPGDSTKITVLFSNSGGLRVGNEEFSFEINLDVRGRKVVIESANGPNEELAFDVDFGRVVLLRNRKVINDTTETCLSILAPLLSRAVEA